MRRGETAGPMKRTVWTLLIGFFDDENKRRGELG
jgi:hypothetical protein